MDGDLSFLVEIEVPGNLSLHFQTPQNLFTPVPEPGTAALLTLGLAGLAWGSRGPQPRTPRAFARLRPALLARR